MSTHARWRAIQRITTSPPHHHTSINLLCQHHLFVTTSTTISTHRLHTRLSQSKNVGLTDVKAIGASPNAVRMQKVVSFYEKLPRGAAPEVQAKGLLGRYQKKYMGKNSSGRRTSFSGPAAVF